jgi:predicted RND superfamily exporter protein
MLALAPFVIWGAVSVPSNTADIAQWLPDRNPARQQYLDFTATFGADNFVLVSWPGCTMDDKRLDVFAERLLQQADIGGPAGQSLIRRIFTGRSMLEDLTGEPLELDHETAMERMRGTLVGPDGQTSAMLVQLASADGPHQHAVIDLIFEVAPRCGLTADSLRLGGTAYKAVMIERESERALRTFAVPCCLAAMLVALVCLRSVRLTGLILAGAVFAEFLSMALVYYTGGRLNAVMIVMPPLIFVLTVSGSVHLINYFRDGIRHRGLQGAADHALGMGWLPCTLASVTTAIGLASLAVSAIAPVRTFGIYAALALLAALAVILVFLPSALRMQLLPERDAAGQRRGMARHILAQRRAGRMAVWLCGKYPWVIAGGLIIVMGLGLGLTRLKTSVKLERSFKQASRFARDYGWIEQHLGPLISVEVVTRFDQQCPLSALNRMELVAELQEGVSGIPGVGGVLSPVTFSRPIPRGASMRQTVQRSVYRSKFEQARPDLIDKGLLAEADGDELWRLSARLPAMGDVDYGGLLEQVKQVGDGVTNKYRAAGIDGVQISYTGLSPLIDRAQQQLLDDLMGSFLLACLLICPIMMIVLRSFRGGLLAMIPNIVPVVCVFGALGWSGSPIDIGTVLTASVALGIAVDDTLHFLTWYSRGLDAGLPRPLAIRAAFQRCSAAMLQTTLICGLGLAVFIFSSYTPASRFAWLTGVLLLAALAGDLILLPAMLASPLGRVFQRQRKPRVLPTGLQVVPEAA